MLGPVPAAVAAAALGDPELLLSLPGFVLALAANRKLAYVSENVVHFLGLSVVSTGYYRCDAPNVVMLSSWAESH